MKHHDGNCIYSQVVGSHKEMLIITKGENRLSVTYFFLGGKLCVVTLLPRVGKDVISTDFTLIMPLSVLIVCHLIITGMYTQKYSEAQQDFNS